KEKRKRSRVTPEQLTHLERIFTQDRSPTAQRRKEISEMLGMQERQTQIWFQNRRAKAKLQEEKRNSRSGPFDLELDSPPNSPPDFDPNYEADIYALIHEEDAVSIIPCTDLCIGSWRRIATGPGKHDLVAYMSLTKRCLT
ncbi:homeobox-domain-containing protein, partial [Sistotremastrum suecicum HHB10207 ss-3]